MSASRSRRSRSRPNVEETFLNTIREQLQLGEVAVPNVRFTDARHGDVEADLLVFFPGAGVAVIEIKGGEVSLEGTQWVTKSGTYKRRINPVEQARRARHAMRSFLDKQPEWPYGLIRSVWFVALPGTSIEGDLSPEARREQLLDSSDLSRLRSRILRELESSLISDPIPPDGWVDDAITILMRGPARNHLTAPGGSLVNEPLLLGARMWPLGRKKSSILISVGVLLAASTLAAFTLLGNADDGDGSCHPSYSPCIPVTTDLNCSDLRIPIDVLGEDIYALDRDGDGKACEMYE